MSFLRPNDSEVAVLRSMSREYFQMHGILAKFYEISKEQENLYSDDSHTYSEPKIIHVIFQQFPNPRVIKKLGWFTGDNDELPFIMYIPFEDKDGNTIVVDENTRIEFLAEYPSLGYEAFKVKKVAGKGFSTLYWVVNVVPVPLIQPVTDANDQNENGFTFLKV
jgi:hypothetical protein